MTEIDYFKTNDDAVTYAKTYGNFGKIGQVQMVCIDQCTLGSGF